MANQIEICNLALYRIGANPIVSLTGSTRESVVCNNLYAFALAAVLRDHDWAFARKYATLALLNETHPEWGYVYAYPSDCAAARRIFNSASREDRDQIPFDVGLSVTGNQQTVLTDQVGAVLIYTASVTNTAAFDAIFCDALAWRLAAEAVQPLRAQTELSQAVANRYLQVLVDAKAKSSNEQKKPVSQGGSFTDYREGSHETGYTLRGH